MRTVTLDARVSLNVTFDVAAYVSPSCGKKSPGLHETALAAIGATVSTVIPKAASCWAVGGWFEGAAYVVVPALPTSSARYVPSATRVPPTIPFQSNDWLPSAVFGSVIVPTSTPVERNTLRTIVSRATVFVQRTRMESR